MLISDCNFLPAAEFVSCPSCGRTLFDLQEVTESIRTRTGHLPGQLLHVSSLMIIIIILTVIIIMMIMIITIIIITVVVIIIVIIIITKSLSCS